MHRSTLAETYKTLVEEKLGLLARIDSDGDVIFKHPDIGSIYISVDEENDPEYFALVFPNFTRLKELGVTKEKALEAINQVNLTKKAVKISLHPSTTDEGEFFMGARVECFLAGSDEAVSMDLVESTFKRNLSCLRAGASEVVRLAKAMAGNASMDISVQPALCLH